MWESVLLQVTKEVIVPELTELIKRKFLATGQWPTKEELDALVDTRAEKIKRVGLDFLNRPKDSDSV